MSELISRRAVKEVLRKVEKIHPYKVWGDRDSYSPYNEGWEDAVCLIEQKITKLQNAVVKDMYVPVKPYKLNTRWHCGNCSTALGRFWVYCQKCGLEIDWEGAKDDGSLKKFHYYGFLVSDGHSRIKSSAACYGRFRQTDPGNHR